MVAAGERLRRRGGGLLEAGDLDGAVRLNVEFWLSESSREVRDAVTPMIRRAFELQAADDAQTSEAETIDLGAIGVPVLVVVGERDKEDFKRIAERLAGALSRARRVVIEGAAHLPALEQPQQTATHASAFLQELDQTPA